jgi:hypothetical protein
LASTTKARAKALKTTTISIPATLTPTGALTAGAPFEVVPNFAVFIDTHRDQPHVPTFEDDIHRGMARPTMVHYIPPATSALTDLGELMRVEDGAVIKVDPKHRFVETAWWEDFVTSYVIEHGVAPISTSGETRGQLPTSHLRNARSKVYKLKSLRQIVRAWEKASVSLTGHAVPPSPAAKAKAKKEKK